MGWSVWAAGIFGGVYGQGAQRLNAQRRQGQRLLQKTGLMEVSWLWAEA